MVATWSTTDKTNFKYLVVLTKKQAENWLGIQARNEGWEAGKGFQILNQKDGERLRYPDGKKVVRQIIGTEVSKHLAMLRILS
jgi:hypothetical protein